MKYGVSGIFFLFFFLFEAAARLDGEEMQSRGLKYTT